MNPFNIYWCIAAVVIGKPLSLFALSVRGVIKDEDAETSFGRKELLVSHLTVVGVLALATAVVAL